MLNYRLFLGAIAKTGRLIPCKILERVEPHATRAFVQKLLPSDHLE